jgi:hypothetical protein
VSALWYAKKSQKKKEPYHRRKRAHLSDTRNKEIKKSRKRKKEPLYRRKRALLFKTLEI